VLPPNMRLKLADCHALRHGINQPSRLKVSVLTVSDSATENTRPFPMTDVAFSPVRAAKMP